MLASGALARDRARRSRSGRNGYDRLAEWSVPLSLLQFAAQLHGPADGTAHLPLGALGAPSRAGQYSKLPCRALPLGLREQLAPPLFGELASHIWR
jgi:hypothetical protein